MSETKPRAWLLPLINVLLLVALLKVGFFANGGARPEFAMLATAVVVVLLFGARPTRLMGSALGATVVISLVYAFYWDRARDAWPLLPWLVAWPAWRFVSGRAAALAEPARQLVRQVGSLCRTLKTAAAALGTRPESRFIPLVVIACAGILLMWPYLTRGIVGAGDAQWYAKTVADYVLQMRAGIFPLWTAQSDFSFYGGIFPLRLAPYLAHLAGAVDLLTARQLPPEAVLNVSLVLSLVAGMMSMYGCLCRLAPGRPWSATGLALAYGLCPGVLGLAYAQDLFMSFCTLPFLPVAFFGTVRSFTHNDVGSRLLMSGGLAGAWLAHPPIGMWCGAAMALTQMVRILTQASSRAAWKHDAMAVGLFILLAGYSFVSVSSLGPMAATDIPATLHLKSIREAFPANWLPLDRDVRALDNLQLGYGLTALGLLVAVHSRGVRSARLLLGCAAGLVLLVVPVPFLTETVWQALPGTVLNITNMWPQQRVLVLAAVCVPMACALWLGAGGMTARTLRLFQVVLLGSLVWGGFEAAKFIRVGHAKAGGWREATLHFRPENRTMTKSALGPLRVMPRYFNHGVTEVQLEHRFLAVGDREVIRHATDAIMPGAGPGAANPPRNLPRRFTGRLDAELPLLHLEPRLTLELGKRYLLVMEFLDRDYSGILKMEGPDFFRVYRLPEAGHERSFGAQAGNSRWLALWQTTGRAEDINLLWIPDHPQAWGESGREFANFDLIEYQPDALDVVVDSLLPYRVTVRAPAESYLETPRIHYPGYEAKVDGQRVPADKSPDGLVMVKLAAGSHTVELTYVAPLLVRAAYWLGLSAWLGFLVYTVRYFRRDTA